MSTSVNLESPAKELLRRDIESLFECEQRAANSEQGGARLTFFDARFGDPRPSLELQQMALWLVAESAECGFVSRGTVEACDVNCKCALEVPGVHTRAIAIKNTVKLNALGNHPSLPASHSCLHPKLQIHEGLGNQLHNLSWIRQTVHCCVC